MDANNYTDIPDKFKLLNFFESDPVESNPVDGFGVMREMMEKEKF